MIMKWVRNMDAIQRIKYLDEMVKTLQLNNLNVIQLTQYYDEVKKAMSSGLDNALYYLVALANAQAIVCSEMDDTIYKALMKNLRLEMASLINKQLAKQGFSFTKYCMEMKANLAYGISFSAFKKYCDMFDMAVYARTDEVDLLDWAESLLATKIVTTDPLEIIQLNGYKKKLKQYAVCAHRHLEQVATKQY